MYEVTYEDQSELKIITAGYEPTRFADERNDFSVPVREVDSFTEAEQIFEEMVGDPPSTGDFETGLQRGITVGHGKI